MAELGEALTERELEVLECVANGASNRETALALSISPNTVKVHMRNIYTKLGVSTRTEATTAALQQGLLSMPGLEAAAPEPAGELRPVVTPGEAPPIIPAEAAVEEVVETAPVTEAAGRMRARSLWIGAAVLGLVVVIALALLLSGALDGNNILADSPEPSNEPVFSETPIANTGWAISRNLPQPRAGMASAVVGLNLYQIGGETAEGVVNSLQVYAIADHEWRNGAPKLTAVSDAPAVVLNGEVYVLGGRTAGGQPTANVEAYSPLNDGWRPVTPLPRPVYGGLALVSDNFIYYFGGHDGDTVVAESYRYDPAREQWEALPPLETPRTSSVGGVLAGRLYVVGGENEEGAMADCAVFDPTEAAWSECAEMLAARTGAGAAVLLNKLYVFGGQTAGAERFAEVYDAAEDEWSEIAVPMLEEYPEWASMGVANVETRIYVLGGRQADTLLDGTYVYTPLTYQFFIPAASAGGDE